MDWAGSHRLPKSLIGCFWHKKTSLWRRVSGLNLPEPLLLLLYYSFILNGLSCSNLVHSNAVPDLLACFIYSLLSVPTLARATSGVAWWSMAISPPRRNKYLPMKLYSGPVLSLIWSLSCWMRLFPYYCTNC